MGWRVRRPRHAALSAHYSGCSRCTSQRPHFPPIACALWHLLRLEDGSRRIVAPLGAARGSLCGMPHPALSASDQIHLATWLLAAFTLVLSVASAALVRPWRHNQHRGAIMTVLPLLAAGCWAVCGLTLWCVPDPLQPAVVVVSAVTALSLSVASAILGGRRQKASDTAFENAVRERLDGSLWNTPKCRIAGVVCPPPTVDANRRDVVCAIIVRNCTPLTVVVDDIVTTVRAYGRDDDPNIDLGLLNAVTGPFNILPGRQQSIPVKARIKDADTAHRGLKAAHVRLHVGCKATVYFKDKKLGPMDQNVDMLDGPGFSWVAMPPVLDANG